MTSSRNTGVLVIAHGSRSGRWVREVEEAVAQAGIHLPVVVGYLEMVEGRSIADGVRKLERWGVRRILAVPLFVSSGSTHLEEIRYALGINRGPCVPTDLQPIHPRAEVFWCPAMDTHSCMVDILTERVRSLSRCPERESLLLVAHGSDKPGFRQKWEKGLQRLSEILKNRFAFPAVDFAMLQVGDVRQKAERLKDFDPVLALPIFLSPGYFTEEVVPKALEDIPCSYLGETYLPHPAVSRWIEETVDRYGSL
ncbi:sirohydrochlorin chelatase [Paludifilum halophilum]|nr:CbiX/SirB N-terminal domain-containing protein [Paludifilum halophilum]